MFRYAVVSLTLLVLLTACQNNTGSESEPPEKVQFVQKMSDTLEVQLGTETGIDAENPSGVAPGVETPNGIFLQWEAVTKGDLNAYEVHRRTGDPSGLFVKIAEVTGEFSAPDTCYLDTSDLDLQTRYYYKIRGRNADGTTGEFSEPDYYSLLTKPVLLSPAVPAQQYNGVFEWSLGGLAELYFAFRLERLGAGNEYVPSQAYLRDIFGNVQSGQSWALSKLAEDSTISLLPGNYRWRIDVRRLGDTRRGAESNWGYFLVNP